MADLTAALRLCQYNVEPPAQTGCFDPFAVEHRFRRAHVPTSRPVAVRAQPASGHRTHNSSASITIVVNLSSSPENAAASSPRVTIADLGSVFRLFEREPPGLLYHYTSLDGMKGVLESSSIWATDIAFLNDAAEVAHANSLTAHAIEQALRKLEASSARNPHLPGDDGWAERFYAGVRESIVEPRSANVLVTSFSEHADQLSQWRGYCPPGAGYALGFDGAALRDSFRAAGMWFAPCIYDEAEQRLQVARLVETSILYGLRWTPRTKSQEEEDIARAVRIFAHEHAPLAALLKHSSFSEECE